MQALSDVSFSVEAGEYNVRYYPYSDSVQNRLNEAASVTVKNQDAAIKETYSFDRFSFTASRDGDALEVNEDIAHGEASGGVLTDVSVIALPDYNKLQGRMCSSKKAKC